MHIQNITLVTALILAAAPAHAQFSLGKLKDAVKGKAATKVTEKAADKAGVPSPSGGDSSSGSSSSLFGSSSAPSREEKLALIKSQKFEWGKDPEAPMTPLHRNHVGQNLFAPAEIKLDNADEGIYGKTFDGSGSVFMQAYLPRSSANQAKGYFDAQLLSSSLNNDLYVRLTLDGGTPCPELLEMGIAEEGNGWNTFGFPLLRVVPKGEHPVHKAIRETLLSQLNKLPVGRHTVKVELGMWGWLGDVKNDTVISFSDPQKAVFLVSSAGEFTITTSKDFIARCATPLPTPGRRDPALEADLLKAAKAYYADSKRVPVKAILTDQLWRVEMGPGGLPLKRNLLCHLIVREEDGSYSQMTNLYTQDHMGGGNYGATYQSGIRSGISKFVQAPK